MKTIDVTEILSTELRSRNRVADLLLFVKNTQEKEIVLDFRNVKFATRSFIDEFYNSFLKDSLSKPYSLKMINGPDNINKMIDIISRTQTKAKPISSDSKVISFNDVKEMLGYISSM